MPTIQSSRSRCLWLVPAARRSQVENRLVASRSSAPDTVAIQEHNGIPHRKFGDEVFKIVGGKRLRGTIPVSGSKNSSLAIIVAALLTADTTRIHNVPDISDIHSMLLLLKALGAEANYTPTCDYCGTVTVCPRRVSASPPEDLVRQIRASVLLAGPLLSRCGKVSIASPGGCAIGNNKRPVNLHIDILTAMGVKVEAFGRHFEMIAEDRLHGADVKLSYPSVGATCTFLLAAASAQGSSKLQNAALEPEVMDLAFALESMGVTVGGIGTRCVTVDPAEHLKGLDWTVIPDRIEAGTYLEAAAITGSCLTVTPCVPEHCQPVCDVLLQIGCNLEMSPLDQSGQCSITLKRPAETMTGMNVLAAPFPGFPTDMLPQTTALLATCQGTSMLRDGVFDSRMQGHLHMITQFAGASAQILQLSSNTAWIEDTRNHQGIVARRLEAAEVRASDLRAGAALLLCALAANGESTIRNVAQISRGYSKCWQKLAQVGAVISFEVAGEEVFASGKYAKRVRAERTR